MELKGYQKRVMHDLTDYMNILNAEADLNRAWNRYWTERDVPVGFGGVPFYNNSIAGVPHICMKVPTGGGKTFMACAAIKRIFDVMPQDKPKVVIWLVPSETILTQTIKNLSSPSHDYHLRLEADFGGRVGVYTKEMLLSGQNFSPDTVREMLTVCILSYASLRIDGRNREVRKAYQENGNLIKFAEYFHDRELLLADTPDTALIQVLRQLSPVTIVDESHNAESTLSVEMLNNLNPSFVLDLTATPRANSNVISYVDARELKRENMVKLPVIVYNRSNRKDVMQDAIQLRASIERQAIEEENRGGAYIRPILLFQAQPRTNEENDTFDKIKQKLKDMGIPENEIAIKTSDINEIGKTDLLSKDCPIRYIITVNALKEGWDCPFAYILASLANKTSPVDVEQIVGRILRQPYTKKHSQPLLNNSFVLTCSQNFHDTLDKIVVGLNNAGFSRKDYRAADNEIKTTARPEPPVQVGMDLTPQTDSFDDIMPNEIRANLERFAQSGESPSVVDMIASATVQAQEYESAAASSENNAFIGGELGNMLKQNAMQKQFEEDAKSLLIPQFFHKTAPDLFGDDTKILYPESLSNDFTLNGQDANISFELATGEMYQVDIQSEGEAVPKYKRASKEESAFIREWLATLPEAKRITKCAEIIGRQINKNNRYKESDISAYVRRIIENMTNDELAAMETAIPTYAQKIQTKIELLENDYREKQFYSRLDSGKIKCLPNYSLPAVITPADTIDSIPYSLYEAERNDMDGLEREVIDAIIGLGNILWWHRIIDRKDFCINGFINHYPDFMVRTKKGNLVLIEAKGDYLDGDNSKSKLKLGRTWAACAGDAYRYFMVFKNRKLDQDGSYTLDEFMKIMKEL